MSNKHIKICSMALVSREMQIKTMIIHYYIPTELAKLKILINISDVEYVELSHTAIGNIKLYSHFGKKVDCFLQS